MGQLLHGSATTTEAVRRAIQHSHESLRRLAQRYGINPKTVTKWKKRASVADLPTGPREPRSTALSVEGEAVIVAFRRYKLPSLDSRLYALQPTIPHLAHSSPHRYPQRHSIGRLPDVEDNRATTKKMESYPSGYFHIDIVELHRARQAAHVRRHRPHLEARLRRTAREGPHRRFQGVTAAPDQGCSLQDPHRAHRQRQPAQHARRRRVGRAAD